MQLTHAELKEGQTVVYDGQTWEVGNKTENLVELHQPGTLNCVPIAANQVPYLLTRDPQETEHTEAKARTADTLRAALQEIASTPYSLDGRDPVQTLVKIARRAIEAAELATLSPASTPANAPAFIDYGAPLVQAPTLTQIQADPQTREVLRTQGEAAAIDTYLTKHATREYAAEQVLSAFSKEYRAKFQQAQTCGALTTQEKQTHAYVIAKVCLSITAERFQPTPGSAFTKLARNLRKFI